jgi:hypothetical protein
MTNPSRVQAGTPNGGQFAPAARTEADVDLNDQGAAVPPGISYRKIGSKGERAPVVAMRLAKLRAGDPVRIWQDGRAIEVTVTREFRRSDGGGFGSLDHSTISVGFGPGRWNTEVSGARIADGYVDLEIPERHDRRE